jgi:hypothetical protein
MVNGRLLIKEIVPGDVMPAPLAYLVGVFHTLLSHFLSSDDGGAAGQHLLGDEWAWPAAFFMGRSRPTSAPWQRMSSERRMVPVCNRTGCSIGTEMDGFTRLQRNTIR